MSEQLLFILKLCLLALLYLFFFRVLRAVWAELRPPKLIEVAPRAVAVPAKGRSARKAAKQQQRIQAPAQPRLVVVEPTAQRGRAFPLGAEMTVGRAAGCQITLDDTYASQIHARVFQRDGQFLVEDLGSTNGTYLNRQKVAGPMVMHTGDKMQIGNTVMELA
ncbi:MAG: FHA domain-containing protein FhaB/FipA [Acidimicrobiales bacterium]